MTTWCAPFKQFTVLEIGTDNETALVLRENLHALRTNPEFTYLHVDPQPDEFLLRQLRQMETIRLGEYYSSGDLAAFLADAQSDFLPDFLYCVFDPIDALSFCRDQEYVFDLVLVHAEAPELEHVLDAIKHLIYGHTMIMVDNYHVDGRIKQITDAWMRSELRIHPGWSGGGPPIPSVKSSGTMLLPPLIYGFSIGGDTGTNEHSFLFDGSVFSRLNTGDKPNPPARWSAGKWIAPGYDAVPLLAITSYPDSDGSRRLFEGSPGRPPRGWGLPPRSQPNPGSSPRRRELPINSRPRNLRTSFEKIDRPMVTIYD